MKSKLIILMVIVIVALAGSLNFMYARYKFMKSEKVRYETNYEAMKQQESEKALVERVIKKEFKKMFPELKKIAEQSGIKVRNIETIHNIYYKTIWDTIPVEVGLVTDPLDDQKLQFIESRNCIDLEGYIGFVNSPIVLTSKNKEGIDLIFTKVEQNDTITTFYFWERKLKKILFVKLKIGRKRLWSESHSSCKASVVTKSIQIERKREK